MIPERTSMRYISIPKPGKVSIENCAIPAPGKGEALLRLLYGGICGSDLGTYKGTFLYASYPRIPGHEFSAEIAEVAPNEYGLEKGMIVTANPYFNCGTCYSCQRGYVNCCVHNETMGSQRDGAFREYITMPVGKIYHGKGLSPEKLALIEPFCISYHAAKRAQIKTGDRVLVVGSGTIGCLAIAAAIMLGAKVYASDISAFKLEKAKLFGATDVYVNNCSDGFLEWVDKITGGNGFDVCMEAAGLPGTFQNCIDAAAYQGRVVVIGIGKQSLDFRYSVIQTKELNIFGSRNALKDDFIELIDAVLSGKVDVSQLITDVYPFNEAPAAFREFAQNGQTKLKTLIRFPEV